MDKTALPGPRGGGLREPSCSVMGTVIEVCTHRGRDSTVERAVPGKCLVNTGGIEVKAVLR